MVSKNVLIVYKQTQKLKHKQFMYIINNNYSNNNNKIKTPHSGVLSYIQTYYVLYHCVRLNYSYFIID